MDVSAVNRIVQEPPASAATTAPDPAAPPSREVVQAVKALNQTEMFGQGNQLQFQWDSTARRMVIRLVDRETGEVVSQVSPPSILRLAETLKVT
jgi:uncharacterized FlaG/YvyC family protein